jgi:hypothetical protein
VREKLFFWDIMLAYVPLRLLLMTFVELCGIISQNIELFRTTENFRCNKKSLMVPQGCLY